jgi:hypothetical protein
MPRNNQGSRSGRGGNNRDNDSWTGSGMMEMARERPIAAAAAAAAAVGAGVFLWNRRNQISDQISNLSDQIGEWAENMTGQGDSNDWTDDTAGLTTSGTTGKARSSKAMGRSSGSGNRGRTTISSRRGMSETGGGNASLGAHSGGIGTSTTGSPSGRGRASQTENT